LDALRGVAFSAALSVYILIVIGGVVTATGSGLACPDWPLCHGKIVPPLDPLIWIEWGHRLLASVVGMLTVVVAFSYRKKLGFIVFFPLILVVFQALLGGMTVKGILNPTWVSLHLAFGLLYFLSLIWLYLRAGGTSILKWAWIAPFETRYQISQREICAPARPRSLRPRAYSPSAFEPCPLGLREGFSRSYPSPFNFFGFLWLFCLFGTLIVYLQAVLGGAVASSGAGLACPDFPTCYGAWIPELRGGIALQFFHRVGALLVTLISVFLVILSRKSVIPNEAARGGVRNLPLLILILTLTQVGLGISNVLFRLPEMLSILHLAVATLLFANFIVLTYRVRYERLSGFNQTEN